MRRALITLGLLAVLAAGGAWILTAPDPIPEARIAGLTGDPEHGQLIFDAAGCASCHMAPDAERAEGEPPVLAGGEAFQSAFGTFHAPNISPGPAGIGGWSDAQIVNAVMRGVAPGGVHLYPALPYGAYIKAEVQDMVDMTAYLRGLPVSDAESLPHDLSFPFTIRRAVGAWKLLFLDEDWVIEGDLTQAQQRGRYLVEAVTHCGECHTPRNALGGLKLSDWLAGAENPSGEGSIPDITPGGLDWSESDIAQYLSSGFTPEFDTAGGAMADVIANSTSRMGDDDRAAIAAYLKIVPPSGG
ncbi:c-type cytochrome [Pseudoroseicyclus aestuarii]|uniref:Mono/diheme cytochrome c family protein n=1 Tax=Pseudoroseicyclus aestuarii TaxID=1795041 RepID=A0A318T3X0_9RHOB|nr:cytochrome c [Pseudoroseicyclus aestuarii]PYE81188.1 mono/diheme cytochrome c family protein [Pseudoroseicyclus aestuarii]